MFGFGKRKNEVITASKVPQASPPGEEETPAGLLQRLRKGLGKTRQGLGGGLAGLLRGKRIDRDTLEDIETLLLTADVGVEATTEIIRELTAQVDRKELTDPLLLTAALKRLLSGILKACDRPRLEPAAGRPRLLMMVGINGAGKTTTIGKLAQHFRREGKRVMLAAGDTFRAAAVEQLQVWGERNDVPVIAQHTGADAASVCFDAARAAAARGMDILIADTAGRLHTKTNLMDELAKIVRVIKKVDESAPHETLLVVDATTGQNAVNQALEFDQAVGLTGIVLTKLDGTAKGGVVFALARRAGVPIRYIGIGEGIDDLRPFDPDAFVEALFDQ